MVVFPGTSAGEAHRGNPLTQKTVPKCCWTSKKPRFQCSFEALQMPLEKKLPIVSQCEDLLL